VITTLRGRLQGKNSRTYPSRREVANLLRKQEHQADKRRRVHGTGAALLDGPLNFQPGLVALHDDLVDVLAYLDALEYRAMATGQPYSLGAAMAAAGDALGAAIKQVATAATETATQP
jgi:hypothetical protein